MRIIIISNKELTIKNGFASISFNMLSIILVLISGLHPSYLVFKIIDDGQVVDVAVF
jgi:hypothetical protein